MAEESTPTERMAIIEHRVSAQEALASRVELSISRISTSLDKLVRLEERQATASAALERAFSEIADLKRRTGNIEREMPTMVLVRRIVFGCAALLAVNSAGLLWLLMIAPKGPL